MKSNSKAFRKAKSLIEKHQYVLDSEWSEAQPSSTDENKYLDQHGWTDYGQWYLGLENDEKDETKGHYKFPFGDFKRVHRSGIIAAKQRAAQSHYEDIEKQADELLELIDKPSSN